MQNKGRSHDLRNNVLLAGVKPLMNFNQLKESLAAPLAALFLLLTLYFSAAHRPQPQVGLRVPMMKLKQHPAGYVCEDDIQIMARLTADGRMWINWTQISPNDMQLRLAEIFKGRNERVVGVMVDQTISYARFAAFLSLVNSTMPDTHVILLTPALQRRFIDPNIVRIRDEPWAYVPPCDLEWKENGYNAPSMFENDLAPH